MSTSPFWRKQRLDLSGADIENTVNEAALLAARRSKKSIGMSEFQEAIERVQLGTGAQEPHPER